MLSNSRRASVLIESHFKSNFKAFHNDYLFDPKDDFTYSSFSFWESSLFHFHLFITLFLLWLLWSPSSKASSLMSNILSKCTHTYIIGHYNASVRIIDLVIFGIWKIIRKSPLFVSLSIRGIPANCVANTLTRINVT